MTKDEALKMAIEFIYKSQFESGGNYYVNRDKTIKACKEALEQPTQESVAFRHKTTGEFCTGGFELKHLDQWMPLYNQPAPTWQGLSDDEIWNIANFLGKNKEWDYPVMFAKTIEKALKEKNNAMQSKL